MLKYPPLNTHDACIASLQPARDDIRITSTGTDVGLDGYQHQFRAELYSVVEMTNTVFMEWPRRVKQFRMRVSWSSKVIEVAECRPQKDKVSERPYCYCSL